ncbi:glycosyltransferase family 1 protein [Pedobacter sp. ASV28]|uniref:glycosyltransferase family 4 protein n=1 Tax=Pedobacter sp. ASV28 TaxID=2795123 RepID=UPI0018EADE17
MKAEDRKYIESSNPDLTGFGLSALGARLRIGYDGKRATNNLTGLGNYSRSLIEHLASRFTQHQYFIYSPKVKENLLKLPFFSFKNISLKLPESASFLWRSFGIKKQLQQDLIDLYHGLSHEIPFGIRNTKIKSVVTIHDLIFLRKPNYYKFIDRKIYTLKSRYACKNANRIIAISERTKQDIVALYHIDEKKIDVVYQSCDDLFKTPSSVQKKEEIRKKYNLPAQYILSVGTIEERKNLNLLVEALAKVDSNYTLIVIGKNTPYLKKVQQTITKMNLGNRVVFLNDVPFEDLPTIYQLANLFVYPSFYEGFGIPIIEAIYSKTPVIGATGSCLEEAGGPDSLYISPYHADDLATAINQVLADEQLQQQMIEKSWNYVQRFNNDLIAQQVMDCYLKTLNDD